MLPASGPAQPRSCTAAADGATGIAWVFCDSELHAFSAAERSWLSLPGRFQWRGGKQCQAVAARVHGGKVGWAGMRQDAGTFLNRAGSG